YRFNEDEKRDVLADVVPKNSLLAQPRAAVVAILCRALSSENLPSGNLGEINSRLLPPAQDRVGGKPRAREARLHRHLEPRSGFFESPVGGVTQSEDPTGVANVFLVLHSREDRFAVRRAHQEQSV